MATIAETLGAFAPPVTAPPIPLDSVIADQRQRELQDWLTLPGGPRRLVSRPAPGRLHVVYVMARVDVGGGARIVFDHVAQLNRLGARTTIVSHFPPPEWYPVAGEYRQVPFSVSLADGIPDCDVIVATYWQLIRACAATGIAPVLHFEQGDFHLYEELADPVLEMVGNELRAADATLTISPAAVEILAARYGVEAARLPNAVDRERFHPAPAGDPPAADRPRGRPYLLMLGSDRVAFKGTADVLAAVAAVRARGHDLDLVWVSPSPLDAPAGRVYVAPPQDVLAELYRGATVFVSGSHYETFPLPPLEAMASGCPVVSTANAGVGAYADDGVNCLLVPVGDAPAMADAIARVLGEPGLAAALARGGLATAARFDWDAIGRALHDRLETLGRSRPEPRNAAADWTRALPGGEFADADGPARFAAFLAATDADEIEIPIVFEAFDGHEMARWIPVARRRRPASGGLVRRAYLPFRAPGFRPPYDDARQALLRGEPERALGLFVRRFQASGDAGERAALGRWIALCLVEAGRDDEAAAVLDDGCAAHPDYGDYHYLAARFGEILGRPATAERWADLALLGDGAGYPEFLYGAVTSGRG